MAIDTFFTPQFLTNIFRISPQCYTHVHIFNSTSNCCPFNTVKGTNSVSLLLQMLAALCMLAVAAAATGVEGLEAASPQVSFIHR